jgi:hypothetical protein
VLTTTTDATGTWARAGGGPLERVGHTRDCQAAMVFASVRVVYMLAAGLNMHCADMTSMKGIISHLMDYKQVTTILLLALSGSFFV